MSELLRVEGAGQASSVLTEIRSESLSLADLRLDELRLRRVDAGASIALDCVRSISSMTPTWPSPRCSHHITMHVIALIDDATGIRRILEHLSRWAPRNARQHQRAPPAERKGIAGSKPPARELTYLPSRISPELLNEDNAADQPGRGTELASLRRLELIAQQSTSKLAPIAPVGGCAAERN